MKQLTSAEIRQMFIDFFKEKGHHVEPSASLVPKDDPSLLWINSGVATLKKYFDGTIIPENPRIVNAQKSIRTNDIENVGYTARHHTFFEMLGNFSIGDYFKREAIEWAWEFLTSEKWIGFDADRLSVTVHPEDDEAYNIWLNEINIPAHRIIRLEENFWDIGEGPSGPNTEIFYDRGEAFGSDPSDAELYPGGENERYLEIWNLVFSQFNHNPDDTYTPLPKKNIDTGMGLERMASIIQNTNTNFETDLFMPIIKKVEQFANMEYGSDSQTDTAYKVIADHIRTVAFAIGDHALPSNEGRGYVLRRLIRRAARFAKQIGIEKPFMYKLVSTVGTIMKDYYPEVINQCAHIEIIIKVEEERFLATLNEGLTILTTIMEKASKAQNTVISGVDVFRLYDTYGFPKELTEEYVKDQGFTIDVAGFELEMKKQQERARDARKSIDSMQVQDDLLSSVNVESKFVGYDKTEVKTVIEAMINHDAPVSTVSTDEEAYLYLRETPFYAESGGQIADNGWLYTENAIAYVKDVKKAPNGQHVHHIEIKQGTLNVGEHVKAAVDYVFRTEIVKNHTATHLLHQALKDVLGDHIAQAGSLVTPDRLRFDFTHFEKVKDEELLQIERIVNEKIWQHIPVTIVEEQLEQAKSMGATALFGEKYGDIVRVVQIGEYSIELCGGCHVHNTSEIGLFKITMESGIGAGTRRIEASTSKQAYELTLKKEDILHTSARLLKTKPENVPAQIEQMYEDIKGLQRENESYSTKLSKLEALTLVEKTDIVNEIPFLAQHVQVKDMNQLRNMVDELKQKLGSAVILLAADNNKKVQLAAGVTKDLMGKGLHAGNLIKQAAQICGGGGGGRPDMAQAGGKKVENIQDALSYVETYISQTTER
ncbi:alanine--tRNA ligase [Virgibacillus sp. W0430]|uniref:alanine--tRNA ligase n=1 Tax=Virgibacillus sp. W0430 TaxID=3391580 RepID=UPI003F468C14